MIPARYHPAARTELRGAIAHDEAERGGRGLHLEAEVARVIFRLRHLPRSAPRWRGDFGSYELRRAKVKNHPYLVVYAIHPRYLIVLAIAHTSKQPGYRSARLDASAGSSP